MPADLDQLGVPLRGSLYFELSVFKPDRSPEVPAVTPFDDGYYTIHVGGQMFVKILDIGGNVTIAVRGNIVNVLAKIIAKSFRITNSTPTVYDSLTWFGDQDAGSVSSLSFDEVGERIESFKAPLRRAFKELGCDPVTIDVKKTHESYSIWAVSYFKFTTQSL